MQKWRKWEAAEESDWLMALKRERVVALVGNRQRRGKAWRSHRQTSSTQKHQGVRFNRAQKSYFQIIVYRHSKDSSSNVMPHCFSHRFYGAETLFHNALQT
jgi:hypothetical protein